MHHFMVVLLVSVPTKVFLPMYLCLYSLRQQIKKKSLNNKLSQYPLQKEPFKAGSLCHPVCKTVILSWSWKARWKEHRLVEWYIHQGRTHFAVHSPPFLCHYLITNIIVAIIYTTLENDLAFRVRPSSTSGLKPSFKAAMAHQYSCNPGYFCALVTTGSGCFSTQPCPL